MSPRKRAVSEEDEALFRTALKDAKPLKKRHRISAEPSKPPRIFVPLPHFPSEPAYSERPAPLIGGHADAHLRRGRLDPEARLDLHGMTQSAAYRMLLRFLIDAQAQEAIVEPGFQMSFAAVAGLIAVAEWEMTRERTHPRGHIQCRRHDGAGLLGREAVSHFHHG
jgi:hypothetical protein